LLQIQNAICGGGNIKMAAMAAGATIKVVVEHRLQRKMMAKLAILARGSAAAKIAIKAVSRHKFQVASPSNSNCSKYCSCY